jgi:hypothetical protein
MIPPVIELHNSINMANTATNTPAIQPVNAPPRSNAQYYCFRASTDFETALQKVISKFDLNPTEAYYFKGLLWIGPI